MRRRLVSTVAAATVATALAVLGGAGAAQANPSQNVGWLYTVGAGGAVFFDADLAGYPGYEKITVCDNDSNGMGVQARVELTNGSSSSSVYVEDPSNDGHCASRQGNFFPDEQMVDVTVGEYYGSTNWKNQAWAYGYA
jgi:hypothetical protein